MFIGHLGVGFGSKAVEPRISLGTYFMAVQFVDLLWPVLLLLGIERAEIAPGITTVTPLDFTHYPVSHSLLMVLVWGALFGLAYRLIKRNSRGALILGLCVLSHWLLDLIVHRPDLPLYPGSDILLGFGLWNSLPGTLIVEGLIFAAGIWYYLKATEAKDRIGSYGFWALAGFLALTYLANLFGPPPPSMAAVAWAGNLQWLMVLWAYWVDRHRSGRET